MNNRWLWIGLIVFLVLLGALKWKNRPQQAVSEETLQPGALLLPFDINRVAQFDVATVSATSTIVRREGTWIETSLWNYPADFGKVTRYLRQLADLRVGQVIRGGADALAEFGLDPSATDVETPTVVSFQDADGNLLGRLAIGRSRRPPQAERAVSISPGWYVRMDTDAVALVNAFLGDFPRTAREWINTTLLQVPASDVQEISVTTTGSTYRLIRQDPTRFALADPAAHEELRRDSADQVARALSYLAFTQVAEAGKTDEEMGFDRPEIYRAKTAEGLVYEIRLGAPVDENSRYARLAVEVEPPAPPEPPAEEPAPEGAATGTPSPAEKHAAALKEYESHTARLKEKAGELNNLFQSWTYVLPKYTCDSLAMDRSALVEIKSEPPPMEEHAVPPAEAEPETGEMEPAPPPEPPLPAP